MHLTRDEVAVMLRVSVDTVDRRIKAQELKAVKIGRRVLVDEDVLDAYMKDNQVAAAEEAVSS
jgi:excisionase family DNA binding protein